ncbi:penicillin-binding protein activator [Paludibacterium yongneupense]|nr:penicillin-binding protein activator [Paludibacterium yongneupense]
MQKLAPLVVGIVLTWLGAHAAAQQPDYIIQLNAAPLQSLNEPPLPRPAAAAAAAAVTSLPASAPQTVRAGHTPAHIRIGLLLPTESRTLGEAAQVVRAGFEAAAATEQNAEVVFVDEQENNVAARYREAVAGGVNVMVGPLTRQGIAAVAPFVKVPTLVLNTLEPGTPASPRLLSLSLSVESEGRQIARQMHEDGRMAPLVVSDDEALSRRLQQAFADEWRRLGGHAPAALVWNGGAPAGLAAAVAASDGVFVALEPHAAAVLKAGLSPDLAVYATSQLNTRSPEAGLAGIRFIDMPWFLMREQSEVKRYPRPQSTLTLQTERLYALGIDAYRLAVMMAQPRWTASGLRLNGVTGDLKLGRDRQFERNLPLSIMTADAPAK